MNTELYASSSSIGHCVPRAPDPLTIKLLVQQAAWIELLYSAPYIELVRLGLIGVAWSKVTDALRAWFDAGSPDHQRPDFHPSTQQLLASVSLLLDVAAPRHPTREQAEWNSWDYPDLLGKETSS